jgi:Polysaccharide deacetylase
MLERAVNRTEGSAPPKGWKGTLGTSVSVMLEGWADDSAPGIGPMGNPLKPGVLDLQARSWAAYGPETGAWRLMDILEKFGLKAVFYTSGIVAQRYPALLQAIAAMGHSIAAHGWSQNVVPAYQTAAEEEHDLTRSMEAIQTSAGRRPSGFLSPRCTPSAATAGILAKRGFDWHADYFDTDLPRVISMPEGKLVAMPFTIEVNDMPLYVRYGNEPEAFTRIFERFIAGVRHIPRPTSCLDITVHAHVFGRPAGAVAFRETLEIARRHEDVVWLTDHAELAAITAAG